MRFKNINFGTLAKVKYAVSEQLLGRYASHYPNSMF
jgi:hypothetical protein